MAHNGKSKEGYSSTEQSTSQSTSNSSSDDSSSTPNTPPSPPVQLIDLPRTPPQAVIVRRESPQNGRYSADGAKKSQRSSPSKSRLGAIDEDSDSVNPDLPPRNPLRRLGIHPFKFYLPPIPTLYGKRSPPKNMYDDVEGPRGEKFSDLRNNRKSVTRRRGSWKALVCIACIMLIIGSAVAIGVIVGLKVRSNKNKMKNMPVNATDPGDGTASPVGRYSIDSYLINVNTSCTSISGTWRCPPYETYSTSPIASFSTTNWIINTTNNRFTISSADRIFSYTFQDVPLTKMNNGTGDELWAFTTTFDKSVFPYPAITNDGGNARCFFNNTKLTGWLYTKKPKASALQNSTASTSSSSNAYRPWPYALDFAESHDNGAGVPDCYRWNNGELGAAISIPISTGYTSARSCQCQYTNFF